MPRAPSGTFRGRGLSDGAERLIGYAVIPAGRFIVTVAATRQEVFAGYWRSFLLTCGYLSLALLALALGAWALIRQMQHRGRLAVELQLSEARFRDFAQSSSDWFWESDDQHRFRWMSDPIEAVSGTPASWHLGKTRFDIAAPDQPLSKAWETHLACLAERRPFRDFDYLRRSPGGDRILRVSGVPVFTEDGAFAGYRGTGRDISDLKRAEDQLRDAIESIPGGFLLFDADGRLAYVNKNSAKFVPEMAGTDRIGDSFEVILRRTLDER